MSGRDSERFRRLLRIRSVERDLEEELAFHFERVVEELMAQGRSRGEAEAEARRRFGDEARYRRELRSIDRGAESRHRWRERLAAAQGALTYAFRSVRASPGLSLGIILAFALGIGANATVFGMVDRLLLRPPAHIAEPDEVRRLLIDRFSPFRNERIIATTFTYPGYRDLIAVSGFADVAAITSPRTLTLGRGEDAVRVEGVLVTGNFFAMLGVRPALGRFFGPEEDVRGGEGVVVISHGLWRRHFGGAPDVLGRTVDFGYGPYTVVGVAPRGFTGVDLSRVDVWLPLHVAAYPMQGDQWERSRGWWWLRAFARLAPGATAEGAQAEATAAHRAGRAEYIERGQYDPEVEVLASPLLVARGPNAGPEATVARWLAGVSLIVLLIACVNVANLLLARAIRQRRELGIRLALGITRSRLVGQIVLQGMLLGLVGGAAALALARWGGGPIRRLVLPDVAWEEYGLDGTVLGAVLLLSLLAGAVSAIVPAVQAARRDVADTLRSGTGGGLTRSTSRVRTTLSLVQAALSVVLLVGAGLFVRSLDRVRSLDLGFDPDGLFYAVPITTLGDVDNEQQRQYFTRGVEALSRLPGVAHAGATATLPFYSSISEALYIPGFDSIPTPPSGGPYVHAVEGGYFAALDLRILRGRGIGPQDVEGAPRIAVIGETMARLLWPNESPLGKCLHVPGREAPCREVVGVVEDARRNRISEGETMQYYVPVRQEVVGLVPSIFVLRARGDEAAVATAVRRELLALDSRVRYVDVQPVQSLIDPQTRSWALGATMFSLFGLLALLVAGIGLYSVLAFDVAQRTREMGLRSALGATTGALLGMVITRALRLTALGIALGAGAALLVAPRIEDLLYEVPARDPTTFLVVAATLLLVAVAASTLPALRAARVDPNVALRTE